MSRDEPEPLDAAIAGAASRVFNGVMPTPGSGWAAGDTDVIPSNIEDGIWWICDRNGRTLDLIDANRFRSVRELANHLTKLDKLAGTDAAELDVDQPEGSDKGVH